MAQAAHWWNEQDGSESRWGLKNASTLDQADRAVTSSLRPRGWTSDNPEGALGFQNRLTAAQEAFRQLSGGQGQPNPSGTVGATQGDPRADMPVEGGKEIGGQLPTVAKTSAPWGMNFDDVMNGGPGILLGQAQKDWSLGDALSGVGIAMMARDNPKSASALAEYIRSGQKIDQDMVSTHYDARSGKIIKIDRNGNATAQQIGDPPKPSLTQQIISGTGELISYDDNGNVVNRQKAFEPPSKPMSDGAQKMFQNNNDRAETAYHAADESQKFTRMLMDGQLDLSAIGRIGNDYANYTNASDEKTRNGARFIAHLEKLRNAGLLEAKGVQTEGDAERMLNTLFPGSARYDNKAVGTLLRDITKDFSERAKTHARYNEPLLSRYKDYDPDGVYKSRYAEQQATLKKNEEAIGSRWDAFLSAPSPVTSTSTEVTGRDPVKSSGVPKHKSFFDTIMGH